MLGDRAWIGGLLLMAIGCGSYEDDVRSLCKVADKNKGMIEAKGYDPSQVITITLDEAPVKSSDGKRLLLDLQRNTGSRQETLRKAMAATNTSSCALMSLVELVDEDAAVAAELEAICGPSPELREKLGAAGPTERLKVYEAHIATKIVTAKGKQFVAALKDGKTPISKRVEAAELELVSRGGGNTSCAYARDLLATSNP